MFQREKARLPGTLKNQKVRDSCRSWVKLLLTLHRLGWDKWALFSDPNPAAG